MKDEQETPTPEPPSPGEAWIVLALLSLPGLLSIPAVLVTMGNYGVGGIWVLFLLTPVVAVITTRRLARQRQRAGTPMRPFEWPLWIFGTLCVSLALSTGCCLIAELYW